MDKRQKEGKGKAKAVTLKVARTMVATMPANTRLMASCLISCFTCTCLLAGLDSKAGAGRLPTNLMAAAQDAQTHFRFIANPVGQLLLE